MRSALFVLSTLVLCIPLTWAATADSVALEDYLAQLAHHDNRVIYSRDLITPAMQVALAPGDVPSVARLRAALPALGLALTDGPAGTLLLVAAPVAPGDVQTHRPPSKPVMTTGVGTIENVVVSASRRDLSFAATNAASTFDQQALERLPTLGQEPLRVTSHMAGTAGDGVSARQHVRGGNTNEQLITLEGMRLYEPFHLKDFHSPASIISRAAIGEMVFYSGGFGPRYGDRMSAVMAISLREPDAPIATEVGLSTLNASLLSLGEFAGGRGDWLAAYRRGNLDLALNALETDFGNPSYSELLLHGGWQMGNRTRVSANALYARDKIALRLPEREVADALYTNQYVWARARTDWTDALASDSVVSYTRISSDRNGLTNIPGVVSGSVDDQREFRILGVQQDWVWRATRAVNVYAGVNLRRIDADYAYTSQALASPPFDAIVGAQPLLTRALVATPKGNQYAVYAGLRWQLAGNWFVDGGGRWDAQTYTTASDDEQVSPRLSVLYQLTPRIDVRVSWGRYYQAQEINELQLDAGLTEFFPAQQADHAIASIAFAVDESLSVRAEVYRNTVSSVQPRFDNLLNPRVLLPELQPGRVRVDANAALMRGVELTINHTPPESTISWWGNYAWSDAYDYTAAGRTPRRWDQTHALKLGASWQPGRWSLSGVASLHSGWPRAQLRLQGTTASIAEAGHWPLFVQLDLRVSHTRALGRGEWQTFLEVSNLTDRSNPCCVEYALAPGDGTLREDIDAWLPLLPTVGVIWRF